MSKRPTSLRASSSRNSFGIHSDAPDQQDIFEDEPDSDESEAAEDDDDGDAYEESDEEGVVEVIAGPSRNAEEDPRFK
jgi:hypothetical protein